MSGDNNNNNNKNSNNEGGDGNSNGGGGGGNARGGGGNNNARGGNNGGGGGGGGNNAKNNASAIKIEEVKPHPIMETLSDVQYCLNSHPPLGESIILGLQHSFIALGVTTLISTLIVPKMGGSNLDKAKVIQNMMFVSSVTTLLQTWFGTRLPVLVGSSHAFIIPTTTIILSSRFSTIDPLDPLQSPHERFKRSMAAVQGSLLVASVVKITLGSSGIWRIFVRFLSPLSMVLLITFTGLGLLDLGFPTLANCVEIGLPQLVLMLFCSQYLSNIMKTKKRIYDKYAVVFCTAIIWVFALILTSIGVYNKRPPSTQISCRTDHAGLIHDAPWVSFPKPFQWGRPTLHLSETVLMTLAGIVALTESTGTFIAAARFASATPVPPSVISRGAFWLGIGTLMNGVLGAVAGSTASVESAGLLGLSRVGSRRVIQISAGFMFFFSIFGKFGAFFASVPSPIMAASYCIFYAYVSSAGLNHLQFCNLNSFRTLFILGFTSFMAISVPQYFRDYRHSVTTNPLGIHSEWFSDAMTVILISSPVVAVVVGMILDNTIHCEEASRSDSGKPWWERFIKFSKEIRNAEFYSLPCKLDNCFPPL